MSSLIRAKLRNLIGSTTTQTGLKVCAQLDRDTYQTGIEITDAEMAQVHIVKADFHGECNYTIMPRNSQR